MRVFDDLVGDLMGIMQVAGRAKSVPLSASPSSVAGLHTNSPPSSTPSTRVITSNATTATGGTGSYSWAYLSGSTAISADAPSSATTTFSGTVSVDTTISAVFRVTSGAETFDVSVNLTYESGL